MRLTDTGEARVRGYLFVLKRSLEASLPPASVADSMQELEGHLRERIDEIDPDPDERTALENLLARIGQPLEVARAYSGELLIDQAVASGRFVTTVRAFWHLATTTVIGFLQALPLLFGYSIGASLFAVAALKPVFPDNVGLIVQDGVPRAFGFVSDLSAGAEVRGGYWVIPIALALGLGLLVLTHGWAKRTLLACQAKRAGAAIARLATGRE